MCTRTTLICSLALALVTASATAESVYIVNIAAQFGTVDLSTGAFTQIGGGLPESGASLVAGPGGSLLTIGNSGELYSINPATGVATPIGSTGLDGSSPGNFANSIVGLNGAFYATDMNNTFYSLNPTTGAATMIGPTGMPGDPGCGAYPNLCDEALFGYNGNLYATYDAFEVGSDGYTNPVTVNPALWQIDPATGVATFISSADLHILALTEISGELMGFQGFPSSTNPLPNPLIEAVSFDPTTGHTSEIVSLGTDIAPISGVAPDIAPTPEPASLALLGTSLAAVAARLRYIRLRR
jgi:PEP-CTERM motif